MAFVASFSAKNSAQLHLKESFVDEAESLVDDPLPDVQVATKAVTKSALPEYEEFSVDDPIALCSIPEAKNFEQCDEILKGLEEKMKALCASVDDIHKRVVTQLRASEMKIRTLSDGNKDSTALVTVQREQEKVRAELLTLRLESESESLDLQKKEVGSFKKILTLYVTKLQEFRTLNEKSEQAVPSKNKPDTEKPTNSPKDIDEGLGKAKGLLEKLEKAQVKLESEESLFELLIGSDKDTPKVEDLPFSLEMLGNQQDQPENQLSFSQALKYTRVGSFNHALPRVHSLRVFANEFLQQIIPNVEERNKTRIQFCADLNEPLQKNQYDDKNKKLGEVLTKWCALGGQNTANAVERLAACNLITAGFNPKTLRLDAPSLEYKIKNGFSSFKRWCYLGYLGKYARNPEQQITADLKFTKALSEALRSELFRSDGKLISLEHAVVTPKHAARASALIIAAIPSNLLICNSEKVSQFLKTLKKFEQEFLSEKNQSGKISSDSSPEKLEIFKKEVHQFHQQASAWIQDNIQNEQKNINPAEAISAEIAGRRKGVLRRAPELLGMKLRGFYAVRGALPACINYFREKYKIERIREQLTRPGYFMSVNQLKAELMNEASQAAKAGADARNINALLNFLDRKSALVEFKTELTKTELKLLVQFGDVINSIWTSLNNDTLSAPRFIRLKQNIIYVEPSKNNEKNKPLNFVDFSQGAVHIIESEPPETDKDGMAVATTQGQKNPPAKPSASTQKSTSQLNPKLSETGRSSSTNSLGNFGVAFQEKPQEILTKDNRCWIRSAWGAAVDCYDEETFIQKMQQVVGNFPLTVADQLTAEDIGSIYKQVKDKPTIGMSKNQNLEQKQRALMIGIMKKHLNDGKLPTLLSSVADDEIQSVIQASLSALENSNPQVSNPQVDYSFIVAFLHELDLSVIVTQTLDQPQGNNTGGRITVFNSNANVDREFGGHAMIHYINRNHFEFFKRKSDVQVTHEAMA